MKQGSKDRYFQDVEDDLKKLVPEGIVGRYLTRAIYLKAFINLSGDYAQEWAIAVPKILQH